MIKTLPITIPYDDLQLDTCKLYEIYEKSIISAFEWEISTQISYRNTMKKAADSLIDIPFCDCTVDDFEQAIQKINENRVKLRKKPYSENTLIGYRSVFVDLCCFAEYYSRGLYSSAIWGSDWKIKNTEASHSKKGRKEQYEAEIKKRVDRLTVLKRSLTLRQELKLFRAISNGIEKNSYYAGLALCFYLGLRPGECCGITFGDIRPLEGYSDVHCIYIYEQITGDGKTSNNLKTINAYRVLPVPEELLALLSKRMDTVEKSIGGNCDDCYIVCAGETPNELKSQCNRRKFSVFSQNILRSIKVDEGVVINLSKEIKFKKAIENNVTTYLLRRNFATALSGVCGMDDDELKYLMGHAIGAADEKRHDFVNPDILYHLWEKLNLRTYNSNFQNVYTIDTRNKPFLLRQKKATIDIKLPDIKINHLYLSVYNEFPNDYIMVTPLEGDSWSICYIPNKEPSDLQKIGRLKLHNEFLEAVYKVKNRLK